MVKRVLLGIGMTLVLSLMVTGVVWAQTQNPPTATPAPSTTTTCPCGRTDGGGRMGMMGQPPADSPMALLAEALDMTVEDVQAALQSGKTVAELAEQQDVALADIVAKLSEPRVAAIDQAVTDGKLTQAQADWLKSNMQEDMLKSLELGLMGGRFGGGMMGGPGMGGRGGRGGHFGGGRMGQGNSTTAPTTTPAPSSTN